MKKHEIILTNKATCEAIGEFNSGHCKHVGDDEGNVFTSILDAAKKAGVTPQYMWKCLQPDGPRTCKGHVYFYIDKRDESFGKVMSRLAETTAEVERRRADEDDARKWRAYQAEQEAKRKAEEKRLEDERKAREKYETDVQKAIDKIERRTKMYERINQQYNAAQERLMEAEKEYEALTGKVYMKETIAEEEVA